jgi:hypothetical protein
VTAVGGIAHSSTIGTSGFNLRVTFPNAGRGEARSRTA